MKQNDIISLYQNDLDVLSVVSCIKRKTKDIIILDEPTDGLSTEQLDRMRGILNQLGIKQIIIVSHEGKIESYVDNVLRVSKNEHVSDITGAVV